MPGTETASPATPAASATDHPGITVSPLSRDTDADAVLGVAQWGFGHAVGDPAYDSQSLDQIEWGRMFGATVAAPAQRLAGIYTAHSTRCPLPGGSSVPAAGLSWVAVHPRDRRRGVLTAMIDHHLDDVATRRGEPLSLLFAAEPAIYGRFGYGLASNSVWLTLNRGAALRDVPGADDLVVDLEHLDLVLHAETVAACYAAVAADRPGCLDRTAEAEAFLDPPHLREGAETLRLATVRKPDGSLRGYALFRRKMGWDGGSPNGTVEVREVIARDAAAARTLWSRLLDLDLTTRITTPPLAVDDPLLHLLIDPRAAVPRLSDGVWVRLVDLPAALAARRYATAVDVVLEVFDDRRPDNTGRWHLRGDTSSATCTRTDRIPALALDVRDLASAYLGGVSLSALAAAGLVTGGDPAALRAASVAFASPVAPWCAWQF